MTVLALGGVLMAALLFWLGLLLLGVGAGGLIPMPKNWAFILIGIGFLLGVASGAVRVGT